MSGFPGWGVIEPPPGGSGGSPPSQPTQWSSSGGGGSICPPVDQDVLDFMAECREWEREAERRGRVIVIDPEYTGRSTDVFEYYRKAYDRWRSDISPSNPMIFQFAPGIHAIRNAWRRQIGHWEACITAEDTYGIVCRGAGSWAWLPGDPTSMADDKWDMPLPASVGQMTVAAVVNVRTSKVYVKDLILGGYDYTFGGSKPDGSTPNSVAFFEGPLARALIGDKPVDEWRTLFDYFDPTYYTDWDEVYPRLAGVTSLLRIAHAPSTKDLGIFVDSCIAFHYYDYVYYQNLDDAATSEETTHNAYVVFDSCRFVPLNVKGAFSDGPILPTAVGKTYIRNCTMAGYGTTNRFFYITGSLRRTIWPGAQPPKYWAENVTFDLASCPGNGSDGICTLWRKVGNHASEPTIISLRNITVRWRNLKLKEEYEAGNREIMGAPPAPRLSWDGEGESADMRYGYCGILLMPRDELYMGELLEPGPMRMYLENITIDGDARWYGPALAFDRSPGPEKVTVSGLRFMTGSLPTSSIGPVPPQHDTDIYIKGINIRLIPEIVDDRVYVQDIVDLLPPADNLRIHWL